MQRRTFLTALAGSLAAAPLSCAQHAGHDIKAAQAIPHHDSPYSHLFDTNIKDLPAAVNGQ